MLNGLSYITDDLTLARFVLEAGFPVEFNDQSNQDPNCPEELKINASNVCNHFLSMYQRYYENQILCLLKFFMDKNDDDNQLRLLQKCIMHAMSARELNPNLTEMSVSAFLDVILS